MRKNRNMKFAKVICSISVLAVPSFGFSPSSMRQRRNDVIQQQRHATVAAVNGDSSMTKDDNPLTSIRLSVEEKAKTVITVCSSGTLCTTSNSEEIEGAPFGSFVDYVLDDEGNPILLMNEMSMHTLNIMSNPEQPVTLFAQFSGKQTADAAPQGQDVSRCSITGLVEKIDPDTAEDIDQIRMRYSITHAYADQVMESPKFAFYRIKPMKVYFVGGFGVLAKWVPVDEYREAASDILAKDASSIVARLNRDHVDDLDLTAKHLLDCEDVERIRVTSLDRLGMDIRVTTQVKGRRNKLNTDEFRIGFRIPVISVEDAKSEVLKVFQEAWEKANGYEWSGDDEAPGSDVPIVKIAADNLG
jgi:putative heme iron utilization protein